MAEQIAVIKQKTAELVIDVEGADQDGALVGWEYTATGMRFTIRGALAAALAALREMGNTTPLAADALHRLIAEEGAGLGWCIERRASRAASAYEAMATQLRALHAAASLSVISVDEICDYSDWYLVESAQEIRAQLDIALTDVDALAKSLRRLAHVPGDAGDEV